VLNNALGNAHPDVATVAESLAILLEIQGNIGEAIPIRAEAAAIRSNYARRNNLPTPAGSLPNT